jgi:hypothetical protein
LESDSSATVSIKISMAEPQKKKLFLLHIIYRFWPGVSLTEASVGILRYITVYHMRILAAHVRYVSNMLVTRDILVCY